MKLFSEFKSFQKHFCDNVGDDVVQFLYQKYCRRINYCIRLENPSDKREFLKLKLEKNKFRILLGELDCENLKDFKERVKDLIKPEKRPVIREYITEFAAEYGIMPVVLHILSASSDKFMDEIVLNFIREQQDVYFAALKEFRIPKAELEKTDDDTNSIDGQVPDKLSNDCQMDNESKKKLDLPINAIKEIYAALNNNNTDLVSLKNELEKLLNNIDKYIKEKDERRELITSINNIIVCINGSEFEIIRNYFSLSPIDFIDEQKSSLITAGDLKKMQADLQKLCSLYSECRDILPVIQLKFDREKSFRLMELSEEIKKVIDEFKESAFTKAECGPADVPDKSNMYDGENAPVIDNGILSDKKKQTTLPFPSGNAIASPVNGDGRSDSLIIQAAALNEIGCGGTMHEKSIVTHEYNDIAGSSGIVEGHLQLTQSSSENCENTSNIDIEPILPEKFIDISEQEADSSHSAMQEEGKTNRPESMDHEAQEENGGKHAGESRGEGTPGWDVVEFETQIAQQEEDSGPPHDSDSILRKSGHNCLKAENDPILHAYGEAILKSLRNLELNSAYWLAKEAENRGIKVKSIPSWVILLCVVSLYSESYGIEERDITDGMYKTHNDPMLEIMNSSGIAKEHAALLMSVISMRPSLLAPECGTVGWLEKYADCLGKHSEGYYDIFKSVLEFANSGAQYCLIGDDDAGGWEERAAMQSDRIRRFVDEIKSKRLSFEPANYFIKHIFEPDYDIGKIFSIIINNKYDKRGIVENIISDLLSSDKSIQEYIIETVSDIQTSVYCCNRAKPIEGKALNILTGRMQEFKEMCKLWLSITGEGIAFLESSEYNWNFEKTREFNKRLISAWNSSKRKVMQPASSIGPQGDIEQIIAQICAQFVDNIIKSHFHSVKAGLDVGINSAAELMPCWKRNLRYPLLFTKFPEIDEDGNYDVTVGLNRESDFLKAYTEGFIIDRALTMHLDLYNFTLANLCANHATDIEKDNRDIIRRISGRETEAKVEILHLVKEIEQKIIQASIDHIISEDEHSSLESQLLAVKKDVQSESGLRGKMYLSFKSLDDIEKRLSELQSRRQDSLKIHFEILGKQIDENSDTLSKNSLDTLKKYLRLGRESLDNGQIGLADQYFDFIESCLKNGEVSEYDPRSSEYENYVKEFSSVLNELLKFLEDEYNPLSQICQCVQSQMHKSFPVARVLRNLQYVPGSRLVEIKNGMEAWQKLKGAGKITGDRSFSDPIANMFMFLGFQITSNDVQFIKTDPAGSTYCRLKMRDGGLSPLAAFGSSRNGIYDVVFIYNKPSSQSIYQSLETMSLHTGCPIVVYFGRLTAKQRDEWADVCRQYKLTALLIDELLMYYLTSIRENRLAATISCGVSLSNIMPYISFGMIPRELFMGRKDMIMSLGRPEGSCIVYGGRQLGKSVLLHMVRQEYHRPQNGVFVLYEDIKTLGIVGGIQKKSDIWRIMLDKMVMEGFLEDSLARLSSTKDISAAIISKLKSNSSHRLIMLLDETDNFIDADAKDNFQEIVMMRKIMDETDRRFKVVLCGLHNVLKYSSIPNHPFAQMMAKPIVVTPLEPKAAQELIINPMTSIGFDFSGEEAKKAVFKILSYTNYHPALIQQFCSEIIREARMDKKRPPVSLTVANVESVYKKEGIKEFIKDRFIWTLDLDTRYAVIVYSMVVEQLYDHDGYRREFTANEILKLAEGYWKAGFKDISYDGFVSILEELIRLGVLVKLESNGTYRLRNANVVRTLGTSEEIYQRLVKITDMASPEMDNIDKIRLDIGKGKASPLTARQMGDLINPSRHGICMVFGSEALGLDNFGDVINYIKLYDRSRLCEDITDKIKNRESVGKALNQLKSREKKNCRQIIAYCFVSKAKIPEGKIHSTLAWLPGYIKEISGTDVNLRVALIFDSDATYRWLIEKHADKNTNRNLEEMADALIFLKKWDYKTFHQYFSVMDIVCSEENAKNAIEATGGWPCLVSRIIEEACGENRNAPPDIKKIIGDVKEEIKRKLEKDKKEFLRKCGLLKSVGTEGFYRFLKQFEPVKVEDIIEFLGDSDEFGLNNLDIRKVNALLDYLKRLALIREDNESISSDLRLEGAFET